MAAPVLLALLPPAAWAQDKPLWEVGLSLTAIYAPDYPGANESRALALPLPFFIYRGDRLRADRDGARAELFETEVIELSFSLGLGLPVRAGGNEARSGMEPLATVVELGPALNLTLARWDNRRHDLKLRLPVRAAFTVESPPRSIGGVFTPNVRLTLRNMPWAGGGDVRLSTGPAFASRAYHRHYYGVAPAQATAIRPAYDPAAGYSGWSAATSGVWEIDRLRVFTFVGADNLAGAAFADSPLVKRSGNVSVGFGVAYVFSASGARVGRDD